MGRKAKPTAIKKLQGNPGKRPLNKREPNPRLIKPRRPAWLTSGAQRVWNRVVPKLFRLGVVSEINGPALAAFCVAWSTFIEADERLQTESWVIETDKGNLIKSPWLQIRDKAFDQARRMMIEFGMTPASMTKVETVPDPEDDEFSRLFGHPVKTGVDG